MHLNEEDFIPDPNEFLYLGENYNPEIMLKTFMSINKGMLNMQQVVTRLAEISAKTEVAVEKIATSMHEQNLAHNDSKKDIERLDKSNQERKDEHKKMMELIEKLFDKVEQIDNELHTSCDIYNQRANEYTDKEIAKIVKYIGFGVVALIGAIGLLYSNITNSIDKNTAHSENHEIHREAVAKITGVSK